jgi:hypothetical protein
MKRLSFYLSKFVTTTQMNGKCDESILKDVTGYLALSLPYYLDAQIKV